MSVFVAVCLAGGLGALARFAVDAALTRLLRRPAWPVGIFAVNLTGTFAAGWAAAAVHGPTLAVTTTGFLGGFTTLSTLLVTVLMMAGERRRALAAAYLLTTAAGCALAVLAGHALGAS